LSAFKRQQEATLSNELERVADSLGHLYGSGVLSEESANALAKVNQQLGQGLGDTAQSKELLLVSVLVDDSTSIARNIEEIRFGYGRLLKALRAELFEADVRVHTRSMNQGVISPYIELAAAPGLTEQNYSGSNLVPVTPLYLASLITLGAVMLKAQEEEARGARVRTFTLIITDGEDNKSGEITAGHVRFVITDMLEFSNEHIVAGMGVGERPVLDFRNIFASMGIPRQWRFTPGTSIDELRRAFRRIAKSLRLAASSQDDFVQLAPGPPPDESIV
jgi:hypothetical protein